MGGELGTKRKGWNTCLDPGTGENEQRVCRWLGALWGLHSTHTSHGTVPGLSGLPLLP